MKCLGRTQTEFKRCSNKGKAKYLGFCNKHRFQSIVIIVSVLGFIGTLAGIYQDILFPLGFFGNKNLEIVDIRIVESDSLPGLDIKLQNNTEDPIFIYEIEGETFNSWEISNPSVQYHFTPISHKYELFLKNGEDQVSRLETSQTIKPKGTDRFLVVLGGDVFNPGGLTLNLFKLKLKFSNSKSITTQKILINIPTNGQALGAYHGPPSLDIIQKNYVASNEIIKQIDSNTVVTNEVLEILKEFSSIDSVQYKKEYLGKI